MNRPPPLHPRAFTIIELLMVLVLLSAAMFIAGRLFESTIRVGRATAQAQDDAASLDAAVNALRADTWAATSLDVPDARTVAVKLAGGTSVVWTISGHIAQRQESNQPPQLWNIPEATTFATDNVELMVRIAPANNRAGGEIRLAREAALLARMAS